MNRQKHHVMPNRVHPPCGGFESSAGFADAEFPDCRMPENRQMRIGAIR
jgi:hypothetical protein